MNVVFSWWKGRGEGEKNSATEDLEGGSIWNVNKNLINNKRECICSIFPGYFIIDLSVLQPTVSKAFSSLR